MSTLHPLDFPLHRLKLPLEQNLLPNIGDSRYGIGIHHAKFGEVADGDNILGDVVARDDNSHIHGEDGNYVHTLQVKIDCCVLSLDFFPGPYRFLFRISILLLF